MTASLCIGWTSKINALAEQQEWRVTSIHSERGSLDEVFRNLTIGDRDRSDSGDGQTDSGTDGKPGGSPRESDRKETAAAKQE